MSVFFRSVSRIIREMVDELSDQTANHRYLAAQGTVHSPQEWRRFQDELWAAKSRPRSSLLSYWADTLTVLWLM